MPPVIEFADVERAHERIARHVLDTPCLESKTLSEITGAQVFLKFENLQFTASFKERGALNKLLCLDATARGRGVIAVSAGNHAQGVAYHAQRLGVKTVIVMPRHTPIVKVEHTRAFGAEVVLYGEVFDDAKAHGLELARSRGLTLIHPYDDADVMAGQGTIAIEMLRSQPQLDVLLVAIGGGGLISGIATAAQAIRPGIEVIGAQTERFPSMYNVIKGESRECGVSTIADGVAVKGAGELTRRVIAERVADIVLVDEGHIERAILLLLEVEKTVVEGAGALGLAALLQYGKRFAGRKVGLVLGGGNIDPLMLAAIIQRGMVRSGRLARVRVDLRDIPGALADATAIIARMN
ncbi:MAG TPA: threonine ammonia-lyase, partial [Burkholderiales bacterium]|nr:threonine ammonia-lyase [Burkholderiales bacterium]